MTRGTLGAVVLSLAVLALFAVGIVPTHLRLDDWGYVLGCPFVKGGLSWAHVTRAFSDLGHGGIWMPLTYISYMADLTLFGGGWRVHHAVNVVLHAVNAILVYRLALSVARGDGDGDGTLAAEGPKTAAVALFAALAWALHPLRAEAVAWVASRKEELWTLWGILGMMSWRGFCRQGGRGRWLATFVCFACACLSKPTAVCLPVLAAAVGLAGPRDDGARGALRRAVRQLALLLPMFLLSFAVGVVAIHSQTHPTGMERVPIADTTFAWRALNAAVSLGLYAWHAVVPVGLHIDYRAVPGQWPLDGTLGLSVLGGVLALLAAFCLYRRTRPLRKPVLLGLLWALVTVLPVLGLAGLTGDKAYADRYTYMPAVGLSLALAAVLARVRLPRVLFGFGAILLLAEAAWTVPTVRSYRDDRSAYMRVLAADPGHWRALRTIGSDYCALQDRMDEGLVMLRRSFALRPSKLTADTLAYVLACRGTRQDRVEVLALGRAVVQDPRRDPGGLMLDALGKVALDGGDATNAVRWLSAALVAPARSHGNVHTMLNLGLALARCGRRDEAREVLRRLANTTNGEVRRRAREAEAQLDAP